MHRQEFAGVPPAEQPVGVDDLTMVRAFCGKSVEMNARLDSFLKGKPTRRGLMDFLGELRQEQLDAKILRVCESAGISDPSGTDKLLAMQIGLLQEQNEALALVADRVGASATRKQLGFTGLVAGVMLGNMLSP